ncbi:MAG: ASCH domain-containing protein [Erysipelotrichaceae bacterium]|nr:ASCH domain-containing protein [Erysipelotrichaceae bacterium]
MANILISIKPQYVEKIFNGSKRYEYRTRLAKRPVDKLIIYSTSPVMKVVGEAEVIDTLKCNREELWNKTKEYSGVTKEAFNRYFPIDKDACAYALGKTTIYQEPKDLKDYGIKAAPQSFIYL